MGRENANVLFAEQLHNEVLVVGSELSWRMVQLMHNADKLEHEMQYSLNCYESMKGGRMRHAKKYEIKRVAPSLKIC